jgi:hypothetical protein
VATASALVALIAGLSIGTVVYWHDRTENANARFEAAAFLAAQASYENARDERTRCIQRVEGREQIRGVFLGITIRLGASQETIDIIQQFLDENYEEISIDDCLPLPDPPEAP